MRRDWERGKEKGINNGMKMEGGSSHLCEPASLLVHCHDGQLETLRFYRKAGQGSSHDITSRYHMTIT